MITDNALYFDIQASETLSFGQDWKKDYWNIPELVQMAWIWKGRRYFYSIPFRDTLPQFIKHAYEAERLIGCDLHRKVSAIKAQILRDYGEEYYEEMGVGAALDKEKRVDLSLSAKKWAGMYGADGRLHAPTVAELFCRCYPGISYNDDNAIDRAELITLCAPALALKGVV